MEKFKVGDKVRVKVFDKRPAFWNYKGKMDKYMGKTVTIAYSNSDGSRYGIVEAKDENNGLGWWFEESDFEPVSVREFIVIRREGQQVIASHKRGDEIVRTATAKCNPSDEFNFDISAKLAFDRMMEEEEPKPESPRYYTGKVFAIKPDCPNGSSGMLNRIGRVFEIKNGELQGETLKYDMSGYVQIKSFSDFCRLACATVWCEVID